jgi:hypothetical protein
MKQPTYLIALFMLLTSGFAADMDHVAKMISADPKDEAMISDAYDAFLTLLSAHEIKAGEIKYPTRITERRENGIIIEHAFYVSPNELRGFSLFIPKNCVVEKDGTLISTATLVLESEEMRQGLRYLVLKKKN